MCLPGRKFSAVSSYRYGFNGKENDKDAGEGVQDYGMRVYSERLGRFLSVDPLTSKYAFYSPYQFAGNMPIKFIDLDGGEPKKAGNKAGDVQTGSNGNGDVHSYEIHDNDHFIIGISAVTSSLSGKGSIASSSMAVVSVTSPSLD